MWDWEGEGRPGVLQERWGEVGVKRGEIVSYWRWGVGWSWREGGMLGSKLGGGKGLVGAGVVLGGGYLDGKGGGVTQDTKFRRRCSCLDPRGRWLGGRWPRLPTGGGGMPFLRLGGIRKARRCRAKMEFEGDMGKGKDIMEVCSGRSCRQRGAMHRVRFLWHPEAKRRTEISI